MTDLIESPFGYSDGDVDTNRSDAVTLNELADQRYSRRTLLRGSSAIVAATMGGSLLAACDSNTAIGDGDTPPAVNAGAATTTNSGRTVTLVGLATDNKGVASMAWTQTGGPTVTLTNPGTIGTVHSVPRLMPGQGFIVGVGSIGYPAEFQGADPAALAELAVSKVTTLTNTYDHRIITGAESGEFLRRIHRLLLGDDGFYDDVFASLAVPYEPARWVPAVIIALYKASTRSAASGVEPEVTFLMEGRRCSLSPGLTRSGE